MHDWLNQLRGRFIVFDGPDGSGKSTQFRRFLSLVHSVDIEVCEVREPGGTEIGEQVRRVLLDPNNKEEIDLRAEMLLFMASRAQLISQRIRPAMKEGKLILADRFISSTLAYQGSAGGLPQEEILAVGRVALGECWPDIVIIFDVDEKTAQARLSPLLKQDRIENKSSEFHRIVREGYLTQAKNDPKHYAVIDARQSPDEVFAALQEAIRTKLA